LLITACLGACLVWAFWELKELRERLARERRPPGKPSSQKLGGFGVRQRHKKNPPA
jgi:hypothetical protein